MASIPDEKKNTLIKASTTQVWYCQSENFYISSVSLSFENTFEEQQYTAF